MKNVFKFCIALSCLFAMGSLSVKNIEAGELEELFTSIEALKIERGGYVLCKVLTQEQLAIAEKNRQEAGSNKVYRFADKTLNVVADKVSNRVLVVYEQFSQVGQTQVQNLVGDLFLAYEDPTVSAHDKVVYWAWGKKGKFTADQYNMAREKKKSLSILATVKLNSDIKIMDKAEAQAKGDAYYIISSDPLLKFFQDS